jgi:ABC-2 type transport system ATP-binding protein
MGRILVRDIILEQRSLGRTVFFSTHILSDVESVCDRVGLIVGGTLQKVGRLSELLSGELLHVDVTVRMDRDLVFPCERLSAQGDERVLRARPDQVDELLRRVLEEGGRILEVQPARQTLENLLFEEVRRKAPVNRKRAGVFA